MKKLIIGLLAFAASFTFAAPNFYTGKIDRIWTEAQDGGFVVTFTSPSSLDDCQHKYALFRSTEMQPELLKNSLSMAMSAFHTGKTVGLVIDKDKNGQDCHVMSIDIRK